VNQHHGPVGHRRDLLSDGAEQQAAQLAAAVRAQRDHVRAAAPRGVGQGAGDVARGGRRRLAARIDAGGTQPPDHAVHQALALVAGARSAFRVDVQHQDLATGRGQLHDGGDRGIRDSSRVDREQDSPVRGAHVVSPRPEVAMSSSAPNASSTSWASSSPPGTRSGSVVIPTPIEPPIVTTAIDRPIEAVSGISG